jgi:hypothetical protein
MKLVCPTCHATHSAESWSSDADARMALLVAAELPGDLGVLIVRYLGLFRPAKRGLDWERARKLLEELADYIKTGNIKRRGREWQPSAMAWRTALQTMLDKRDALDLPLKSHGYLLEILAGQADKAEASAERATEESRREGRAPPPSDDESAERIRNSQINTATILLGSEWNVRQKRFKESMSRAEGLDLLVKRGFDQKIAERACAIFFAAMPARP